jgi:hypothetical protein
VNADCELKICDFGLARGFQPGVVQTEQGQAGFMTECGSSSHGERGIGWRADYQTSLPGGTGLQRSCCLLPTIPNPVSLIPSTFFSSFILYCAPDLCERGLTSSRHVVCRMYLSRTTRRETNLQRRRLRRSIKSNPKFVGYTDRRYSKAGRISSCSRVSPLYSASTPSELQEEQEEKLMIGTFDHCLSNPEYNSRLYTPMLRPSPLICSRNYFRLIRQRGWDVRNLWNTLSESTFPSTFHYPPYSLCFSPTGEAVHLPCHSSYRRCSRTDVSAHPDGCLKLTIACRSGMNLQMNHYVKSHSISDLNKKIQRME